MNAGAHDRVRVEFPADTINMAIARSVAAAIATRADLTVDQIEDVRLAMDEATSYLIKIAATGTSITCDLWVDGAAIHASMACATATATPPDPEPFAWTVLTALVNAIDLTVVNSQAQLRWSLASDHSLRT